MDQKPAAKKKPPTKPAATMAGMTINPVVLPWCWRVIFPYLLKQSRQFFSDGVMRTIIELFVFPMPVETYIVTISPDGRSLSLRCEIPAELTEDERLNEAVRNTTPGTIEREVAQFNRTEHVNVMNGIRQRDPNGPPFLSTPAQVIPLPEQVENVIESKELDWHQGDHRLVPDFAPYNLNPPLGSILRLVSCLFCNTCPPVFRN